MTTRTIAIVGSGLHLVAQGLVQKKRDTAMSPSVKVLSGKICQSGDTVPHAIRISEQTSSGVKLGQTMPQGLRQLVPL